MNHSRLQRVHGFNNPPVFQFTLLFFHYRSFSFSFYGNSLINDLFLWLKSNYMSYMQIFPGAPNCNDYYQQTLHCMTDNRQPPTCIVRCARYYALHKHGCAAGVAVAWTPPQNSASALPAVDVLISGDLHCLDLGNKHTQSITNSLLATSPSQTQAQTFIKPPSIPVRRCMINIYNYFVVRLILLALGSLNGREKSCVCN